MVDPNFFRSTRTDLRKPKASRSEPGTGLALSSAERSSALIEPESPDANLVFAEDGLPAEARVERAVHLRAARFGGQPSRG